MLAIIKTGGKQYKVSDKSVLKIEKLEAEAGKSVSFTPLLIASEDGKTFKLGAPEVKGAKVTAMVLEQGKSKKVNVVKFKSKSRYRRRVGHRQPFTKIQIEEISA
ncbi:MAG: hypothetical protein ACD_76C00029G0007 [uncultured bacterium]|nr:MAG: hypothetical protein ACD_76C00029G0007 [uncultured bacterium]HBD05242.1 50S ribosomal protein L21 [Candidatus Uhrbacteria bacterium]